MRNVLKKMKVEIDSNSTKTSQISNEKKAFMEWFNSVLRFLDIS